MTMPEDPSTAVQDLDTALAVVPAEAPVDVPVDGDGSASGEPAPAEAAPADRAPEAAVVEPTGGPPAGEAPPSPEEERERRRRIALLVLLGGLAFLLIAFSAWYLLFRKPISDLIPPITSYTPPGYSYAVYGLDHPHGIAVSPDGARLYVTQSQGSQQTLVLDGRGAVLGTLRPPIEVNPRPAQLYLAVEPTSGEVYASDRAAGAVYVYAADGTFERVFDPGPVGRGWQPLGIGFDSAGHLFVTDVGSSYHVVHEFGPDGALVRDIGGPGLLDFPNGVTADAAGNIYVTDSNNGRLIVFGPDGIQLAIARRGQNPGNLGLPRGVAIDGSGRVYVVDTTAHRIEVFRVLGPDPAQPLPFLGEFGMQGSREGALQYPNGTAVDQRGRVYVADWANDRIQVWSY